MIVVACCCSLHDEAGAFSPTGSRSTVVSPKGDVAKQGKCS